MHFLVGDITSIVAGNGLMGGGMVGIFAIDIDFQAYKNVLHHHP